eukprot:scpid44777/ scgid15735/ Cytochrome P450 3A14; CYPIIIA14
MNELLLTFALIVLSLILSLIYSWKSRRATGSQPSSDGVDGGDAQDIPALPERRTLLGGHIAWIKEQIKRKGGLRFAGHLVAHEKHRLPVFALHFGPYGFAERACVVADATLAAKLCANDAVGVSSQICDVVNYMIGAGTVFTQNGEAWIKHRNLLGNIFTDEHSTFSVDTVAQVTASEIQRFVESKTVSDNAADGDGAAAAAKSRSPTLQRVEVCEVVERLAMAALAQVCFGVDMTTDHHDFEPILTRFIRCFNKLAITPSLTLWKLTNLLESRNYSSAKEDMLKTLSDLVAERDQKGLESGEDLLSLLLRVEHDGYDRMTIDGVKDNGNRPARKSKAPEVVGFSRQEALEQALMMFVVSHNTISCTLSWLFYYLAKDPNLQYLVYKEVSSVLVDSEQQPTVSACRDLTFTKMVVLETLRLRPAAPLLVRSVNSDVVVGGYRFLKGDHILMSSYLVHRDGQHWQEPEQFDVSRWTSIGTEGYAPRSASHSSFTVSSSQSRRAGSSGSSGSTSSGSGVDLSDVAAYLSFGTGDRMCPAYANAMNQILAITSVWIRKWRMYLAEKTLSEQVSFTYSPGHVYIHLEPRDITEEFQKPTLPPGPRRFVIS